MPSLWPLLPIFALVLMHGLLAAGETAILAVPRAELDAQIAAGCWRARVARELSRNPRLLLTHVRAVMLLLTVLAGSLAGLHLWRPLSDALAAARLAWVARNATWIAPTMLVIGLAAVWLVLGEGLPRLLALAAPRRCAQWTAYPLHWMLLLCWPLAAASAGLSRGVARLVGCRVAQLPITIEDVERLLHAEVNPQAETPPEELVARKARRLGARTVREIMRPRIEIDALDVDTPADEVLGAAAMAGFSRLPVHEGDLDHIIGFVYMKDLLRQQHMGWPMVLRKLVRPALLVPETLRIDKLLETFRQKRTQMALVLDEFGGTEGLVTLEDVLEELVGEIHDELRVERLQTITQRDAHTWLTAGGVSVYDLLEGLRASELRDTVPRDCATAAGLVIALAGRIPRVGDAVTWNGFRLEVLRMDGPRIDQIVVHAPESGGP